MLSLMRCIILIFCFFSVPIFSLEPVAKDWRFDPYHQKNLEECFRNLLVNTEMGYVLYGEKPICIQWASKTNDLMFYNRLDVLFALLGRFVKYLNALCPTWKGNFVVKTSSVRGSDEILFINQKAFLRVVRENLPLFQYVLGPEVTPEKLLQKIVQSSIGLEEHLRGNNVLMGIVLGFGTQNSLFGARCEDLFLLVLNDPRFCIKTDCLLKKTSCKNHEKRNPSFGFSSLEEEHKALFDKLPVSTEYAGKGYPLLPTFCCLDSIESKTILKSYSHARKKIRKLLYSKHFLDDLFVDLQVEFHPLETLNLDFSFDEQTVLNAFAVLFNQSYQQSDCYDAAWRASFIKGLKQKGQPLSCDEYYKLATEMDRVELELQKARSLRKADAFFQDLQERPGLTCVALGKAYYQILEEGTGSETLTEKSKVTLSYLLEHIPNQKSDYGCHEKIAINDFLTGPILCMLGMKVGEVREVWIHPDLASCSAVPTGVHGKIQLLHIEHAPDLDPISTNWIEPLKTREPEELLERRWSEAQCKFAAAYGHVNGHALRYISDIEKIINAFELQKESTRELSPKEEEMVASFKIYHFEKQKAEQERIALKKFASLIPDVTCLIKDRLYVKCIKEGLGPIIKKTDKVKLRYCFKKDEVGVILDETLATIDLENEITAFQLAIPGHRVGTKMSLYIHPELGFESSVWPVGNVFLSSDIEILEAQD